MLLFLIQNLHNHNIRLQLYKVSLTLIVAFYLLSDSVSAQTNACAKIEKLVYIINKLHFQKPEINAAFVNKTLPLFLYHADGNGVFLQKQDCDELYKIAATESDPLKAYCAIYNFMSSRFKIRWNQTDSIITATTWSRLIWKKNDTLYYNREFKNNYPTSIASKKEYLEKWVKLYFINELEDHDKLEAGYEFGANEPLLADALKKIRKGVIGKADKEGNFTAYIEKALLSAIALTSDPHTEYFDRQKKSEFTEYLSPTVELYGFSTDNNEENKIIIASIKPGSPAWKCNSLNIGDQLIKIKLKDKPMIELTDYEPRAFDKLLQNATEKEMDLVVKKKNGLEQEVHLKKEVLHSDENVINSYIINNEKPIGYISLPSFYTDFSSSNELGCANDVAKEIVKLKQQNIKGLIIDLRNNGGGSLEEAINLAGIFIDAGPLIYQKGRAPRPTLLKDFNRGLIYDGPLLILINNQSASASELLVTMLKQHKRAIIAGTNSFGKATAQTILPLDTSVSLARLKPKYDEKDGYVKLTIEKFYDLSGYTYQLKGVEPDIFMPDIQYKLPISESNYRYALVQDNIDKKNNLVIPPDAALAKCIEESKKRIGSSTAFKKVTAVADSANVMYTHNFFELLHPVQNKLEADKDEDARDRFEKMAESTDSTFVVKPNAQLEELIKIDAYMNDQVKSTIDILEKDIVLQESYKILNTYNKE